MIFGKKRNWEDQYDEDYVDRADRRERLGGSTLWIQLAVFGLATALLLAAVGFVSGQAMFEKALAALATPIGLVWLLLIVLAYFCLLFRQGWSALLAITGWLVLTIFGNSFIVNQLLLSLERPHLESNINNLEKLDVVFLLGGGTATNLNGTAQAGIRGDRLVVAARLYHADKVELIVCSGQQLFKTDKLDLHPNQEATRLLAALKVPEASIAMIKGYNTFEEMQIAAEFLNQQNLSNAKIGIVTSATHLNRANRLAQKNGLNPVLIPADFRSRHFTTGPSLLIPSAELLADSALCIKEYLAWAVGR